MDLGVVDDKKGAELENRRFQLLQSIAKDLTSETTFPTSFDLVVRLRKALKDPNQTLDQIARLVSVEPLIPLRLIHLANSALYSRGQEVKDVKAAINRLGLQSVRTSAMSIAMTQLLCSKDMAVFKETSAKLWDHSLSTACAAHVIAKRLTRFNPDEAMLAGLVHDLGAFYLLYRFAQDDELRARPVSATYLAARWHESIGHSLLLSLGIPDEIADAVLDHDATRIPPGRPVSLADVVYVSNILAGGMSAWRDADDHIDGDGKAIEHVDQSYLDLRDEIKEFEVEMRNQLA
jgi:HD-like signal output (HDOD) protein